MSTTSLIARQCRLREWAQMVQDCRNRPEEMSVDEWCVYEIREFRGELDS